MIRACFPIYEPEVDGDHWAFDCPGRDEPAARGERGQTSLEDGATDRIEDDSGPESLHALVVVGERFGAQRAQAVVLRLARGGVDRRSEVASDVDRGLSGAA
jgi:hypothetical protein